ncbi:competence type IV pilus minor pilin ComGG [Geobacillus jurassicus]|uniref:Competence type IV pilus minor pilin ComGG n=1 Tax=Geobacillus jurassicus TaxID=235932 RepID=A0ABV6GR21_9BACL|nr:competence type IV pilus minor pilin ComGG [Geobacillus jurassicus]
MGRQDGVIFPLAAVVALLFSFSAANVLLLYEAERQAAYAARQAAEADELVQMAVFDVKEQIASVDPSTAWKEGEWIYPRGTVAYRWTRESEARVRVALSIRSASGLRRAVTFTVTLPALHIVEWSEPNG